MWFLFKRILLLTIIISINVVTIFSPSVAHSQIVIDDLPNLVSRYDVSASSTLISKIARDLDYGDGFSSTDPVFNASSGVLVMGGWFYFDTIASSQFIIAKERPGFTGEYRLQVLSDGSLLGFVYNTGGGNVSINSGPGFISAGNWYFISMYINTNENKLHINLNDVDTFSTSAVSGTINTGSNDFTLGERSNQTAGMDGAIDQFFVANVADNTEAEDLIAEMYNSGTGVGYEDLSSGTLADLISFYSSGESSGSLNDNHSNYDLTSNGTITSREGFVSATAQNGEAISQWQSSAGSAFHLSQTDNSARPTFDATNNEIDFDGSNDGLQRSNTSMIDVNAHTVYLVAKQNSWVSGRYIWDSRHLTGLRFLLYRTGSTPSVTYTGAASTDWPLGTYDVVVNKEESNVSYIYAGGNVTSGSNSVSNSGEGFALGGKNTIDPMTNNSNMSVKEVLIFNTAHDDATRESITNYLASKWGIAPGAPTSLGGVAGDSQISLSWTAPSDQGANPITDYVVEYKLSADSIWTIFSDGVSTLTNALVSGLTNGLSYDFRVAAVNSSGQGSYGNTYVSTPVTLPGAPTSVTATGDNAQAEITFSAPTSDGGSPITSYTVTSSPGGLTASGASSPITVTGLTNGTAYTFTVSATNGVGEGPASSPSNSVTPATVPDAPTVLVPTSGNGQVSLSWNAPGWNGGASISDYVVEYKEDSDVDWSIFAEAVSTTTDTVITGLTNGTLYNFRVAAVNSIGQGSFSSIVDETPETIPDAPTGVSAVFGNAEASISFSAPAFDGGSPITSYTVTSSPGGLTASGASSPITVTGLTNGTAYTFTVSATNGVGEGPASSPSNSVTPATVPDAPTVLVPTSGNGQVSLSWNAPGWNGGASISDYVVEYKLSSDSVWSIFSDGVGDSTNAVVVGLTNGSSYDFRVSAVNIAGQGASSAEATSIPTTIPDAPTGVSAVFGNAEATISFSAPAFDGGSPITSYTVTSSPGGLTASGASSPITVTGLTNGTAYTFTVTATNGVGEGPASSPSNSVTPATVPGIPQNISAVAGNTEATISFDSPSSDGGSPITSYTVTSSPGGLTASGASSPITVTGLTNGESYTFTVVAENAIGPSATSSTSNEITLSTEPSEPLNLAATALGSSVSLSWSAPSDDGGSSITDYIIEYKLTSGGAWSIFSDGISTQTTATVTGLSNGTSYDFRVSAANFIGQSNFSSSVTATPGEPAQVVILSFSNLIVPTISADARITNEGAIQFEYQYSYCVTDDQNNLCGGGDDIIFSSAAKLIQPGEDFDFSPALNISTPGNYWFHVSVTFGSNTSYASQSFTAIAGVPDAPTDVSAVASNGSATVSFTLPAIDHGSPITSYTVTSSPGGLTASGASSPITVTGLSNGAQYTFTVRAVNSVGQSPASTQSNEVTPATVPGSPTGLTATAGDSQMELSWNAPSSDGGMTITDYVVEYQISSDTSWTIFADGVSVITNTIISGLDNDTTYNFRIKAMNSIGESLPSNLVTQKPIGQAETNPEGSKRSSKRKSIPIISPILDLFKPESEKIKNTPDSAVVIRNNSDEVKVPGNQIDQKADPKGQNGFEKKNITNKVTKDEEQVSTESGSKLQTVLFIGIPLLIALILFVIIRMRIKNKI